MYSIVASILPNRSVYTTVSIYVNNVTDKTLLFHITSQFPLQVWHGNFFLLIFFYNAIIINVIIIFFSSYSPNILSSMLPSPTTMYTILTVSINNVLNWPLQAFVPTLRITYHVHISSASLTMWGYAAIISWHWQFIWFLLWLAVFEFPIAQVYIQIYGSFTLSCSFKGLFPLTSSRKHSVQVIQVLAFRVTD